MAFVEFSDGPKRTGFSSYLKIVTGIPSVIVILDEHPTKVHKHWFKDGSGRRIGINCIGIECPICERNNTLNWDRKHPDYIPRQNRYKLNVLDLTPIKRCPDCGAVYQTSVSRCNVDGCGADLSSVTVEPWGEVKILERGRRLMEQFVALEKVPYPMTGELEKLQSYPIMLVATGSGKEMVITAIPQPRVDIDTESLELFDLVKSGTLLTVEEINFLLNGGVYRDIWEARKASQEITDGSAPDIENRSEEKIPF